MAAPDWQVKTNNDAIRFLSRTFKHLMMQSSRYNGTLEIILDARDRCIAEMLKEAA